MEKHRYYFRLAKPIGTLCELQHKDLPSEKELAKIARNARFPFNERSVQSALYEQGPFADGLLFALAKYLGLPESEFAWLTLDQPKYRESKAGDFFLAGMRSIVENLTGNLRLRNEAFLRSEREIASAVEIIIADYGASMWGDAEVEPTSKQLVDLGLSFPGLPTAEVLKEVLLDYWRFNPLSIIYAVTSARNRVGIAGVLPVTEIAYESVRSGERWPFELTVKDLMLKSNHQLIFICVRRRDEKNKTPAYVQTRSLASSIMIQTAMMAETPLDDLQVLSSGTAENRRRLEQNGFVKLDTSCPAMDIPLYEIKKGAQSFEWAKSLLESIRAANR